MAGHSNQWATGPTAQMAPMPHQQQQQQPQQQGDGYGPQMRPMGLKVQYTFDKDGQVNCLARWPHLLHVQTVPLDERNSIGVIDLRTCLQAVAQCSPEIVNQADYDYTVYASDYSEPDVPLVGQGMLSWGLDPTSDPQSQQLVTGRVTRNLMALFGKGNSETLEVRLKLTAVAKMQQHRAGGPGSNMQPQHHHSRSFQSQPDMAHSEWNSLIQSNPGLGHSANVSTFPSPSLPPASMNNSGHDPRYPSPRPEHLSFQQNRPSSAAPSQQPAQAEDSLPQLPQLPPQQQPQQAQPAQLPPVPTSDMAGPEKPARPSRPSSRASRSRVPTGRPRGRPRKKPLETGHTSGAEMTDADDGPQRKRAKVVTQVDYNTTAPFSSHPDSLRVAASTSGSLRNMRPVGAGAGIPAGSHLQDIPRAPTPVPNGLQQQMRPQAGPPRKGSMSGFDTYQMQPSQPNLQTSMSMNQDARSPTDSIAQSPDQGYTPDQSPADLGSSPPVPRTSAYPQSSPAPSSPTLPTADSGFMSGGMDDFFDEDDLAQDLPQQDGLPDMQPKLPLQKPAPRRANQQEPVPETGLPQPQSFPFQQEHPGPQELLPQTSLFRPHGKAKALNREANRQQALLSQMQPAPFEPRGPPPPVVLAPSRRQLSLQRSYTAPLPPRSAPRPAPETSVSRAAFEVPLESVEQTDMSTSASQVQELTVPSNQPVGQAQMGEDVLLSIKRSASQPEPPVELPVYAPFEQPRILAETTTTEAPGIVEPQVLAPQPTEPQAANTPVTEPELPRADPELLLQTVLAPPAGAKPASAPPNGLRGQVLQAPDALLPPMRPRSPRTQSLPAPPVPASDPVGPTFLSLPQLPEVPQSEGPCPPAEEGEQSGEQPKYSKNLVKKQSIKDRLENAIANGEMPPFCNNCGAIETPTWRKIWTQEHRGIPGFFEFSDKPGCVTTIDILERGPTGEPTLYRLVKKNLDKNDLRIHWKELLLCNPCGIWLAKYKGHRPPDRWEQDADRLNQPRRKRGGQNGEKKSKAKRQRTKSDGQMNPTSDAFPMTDGFGPEDQLDGEDASRSRRQSTQLTEGEREQSQPTQPAMLNLPGPSENQAPGSTHSRGSGTADSPIPVDDSGFEGPRSLGGTRRLLFPSPRKDGVPKVLGELAVNVVQAGPNFQLQPKAATAADKENANPVAARATTPSPPDDDDLDQELFGTPPVRPSTPPPKSANPGPFKTPTRPTPSHRPITRSISRSIRSVKSGALKSPSQALLQLQRTPSRTTPRSVSASGGAMSFSLGLPFSASKRRTPRANHPVHAHFALDNAAGAPFESPFTATINQLLSEANDFTSGSPSHGLADLGDLSSLPDLHSDDVMAQLAAAGNNSHLDFGSCYLPGDMGLPSSPPMFRGGGSRGEHHHHHPFDDSAMADMWAKLAAANDAADGVDDKA